MKEELKKKETPKSNVKVIKTDEGGKIGQDKCPKCGSTDITLNPKNGHLICDFCRHEFEPEKLTGMVEDLSKLEGQVVASGTHNIVADAKDVLTFKCSSCGAEVVVDTSNSTQARCHWCRNMLSINEQIPNGAVPDVVLPFGITKDIARGEIERFVGKRKFFAHPKFRAEFTTQNIMGVYFPYMLVDVNAHAKFVGEGEHQTAKYYVGSGDNKEVRYDADLYHVERDFNIVIDGLSVESNSDRLNNSSKEKTNNIINSIMPFDTENCVKYNSNYLKGYTSEKRDINVDDLKPVIATQSRDIAKFAANESLKQYDRGVAWSTQNIDVKGQQWRAAYLPVWLYSYQEVKGEKKLLHYVAVNARTKETMGSVPIHMPKLILVSIIVEILGIIAMLFTSDSDYSWLFLATGVVFYLVMYARYRNQGARHTYETETKNQISDLKKVDDFIKKKKGLTNATMNGANNRTVSGQSATNKLLDTLKSNIKNG